MRYSARAQSVIQLANQEAARLDHDHISTGHLLLGLIREGEGAAVTILKEANVDLDKMKDELESLMEKGRGSIIGKSQLTTGANNVLKLAAEESQNMGHKYVGSEHLLLGLIRESEGVASKILGKFGVELDATRSAVRAIATDEEEYPETLTFRDVELTVPTLKPEAGYPSFGDEVLNLEEASKLLRITADDLKKLLETDDLPARMLGGQWRFSRSALIKWLGQGSSRGYIKS